MQRLARPVVPVLTLALALPLVALGANQVSATAAPWSPPVALAGGGAEPSIRNAQDGRHAAYVAAPTGLGGNFWYIDDVKNADGTHSLKPSPPRQPDAGTGGGDAEISVGNAADPVTHSDPVAYTGLQNIIPLTNFTSAASVDCGVTFSMLNPVTAQNTGVDRQWQTFDGSKTNFLIYHDVVTSQIVVSRSENGGQTYTTLSPDGTQGIVDAATLPNVVNANKIGNIVTDY